MKNLLKIRKQVISCLSGNPAGNKVLHTAGSSGSADAAPRMTVECGFCTSSLSLRGGFANKEISCRLPRPIGLAMMAELGCSTPTRHAELVSAPQSGRSMVEMLGVLAVMGLLSVGGVAMYTTAMNKYRANELLNEANKRATVVAMQFASGRETASTAEFSGYSTFTGATFDDNAEIKAENNRFKITLNNVSPEICQQIKNMIGTNTTIRNITNDCLSFSFNTNLGTDDSFVDTGNCSNGNIFLSYNDDPCKKNTTDGNFQCKKNTDCIGKIVNGNHCTSSTCYCYLTGSNSFFPDEGYCTILDTGTKIPNSEKTANGILFAKESLLKGKDMTWWSAENWCKAHGKNLVQLSDLGLMNAQEYCTGTDCLTTKGNNMTTDDWDNLKNVISTRWFWTIYKHEGKNTIRVNAYVQKSALDSRTNTYAPLCK